MFYQKIDDSDIKKLKNIALILESKHLRLSNTRGDCLAPGADKTQKWQKFSTQKLQVLPKYKKRDILKG